jgi:hypothetical protein
MQGGLRRRLRGARAGIEYLSVTSPIDRVVGLWVEIEKVDCNHQKYSFDSSLMINYTEGQPDDRSTR